MSIYGLTTGSVVVLHILFFVLESILWTSPVVMRIFGNTELNAKATRVVALNQGFYNLGAAGLLGAFLALQNTEAVAGMLFFIIAMGIVGAITANWRIILIQSLPALLALGALFGS